MYSLSFNQLFNCVITVLRPQIKKKLVLPLIENYVFSYSIILFSDNVTMEFSGQDSTLFKGSKTGKIYLTTHRMIFNNQKSSDPLQSFSFPFVCLSDVSFTSYYMENVTPNFCKNLGWNWTTSIWCKLYSW